MKSMSLLKDACSYAWKTTTSNFLRWVYYSLGVIAIIVVPILMIAMTFMLQGLSYYNIESIIAFLLVFVFLVLSLPVLGFFLCFFYECLVV
jgi:hypothetical protein